MASMVNFATIATQGGYEIREKGGDHILKAIDDFQAWIKDQPERIASPEQERRRGRSNGAKVIGPFTQQVASDDQGFIPQLRALRDSLKEARRGIELAVEAYRRTEEATQANLRKMAT